jgi:N-acetylglucosamine malate deacetylase 1
MLYKHINHKRTDLIPDEDFIRSVARTRGVQIGARYAEAFEMVRWIID